MTVRGTVHDPVHGTTGVAGTASDAPAVDVRAAAVALEELFRAQVAIMRRLQRDPIWDRVSLREYDVLFTLSRAPRGLRLRDLGESSLLSQPSLSRMVERLEEAGWVRREPAAGDGRGVVVGLTAAGAALQKEVGRRHVQAIAHYVGGALDAERLAALTDVAGALRAAQPGIPDLDRDGDGAGHVPGAGSS